MDPQSAGVNVSSSQNSGHPRLVLRTHSQRCGGCHGKTVSWYIHNKMHRPQLFNNMLTSLT